MHLAATNDTMMIIDQSQQCLGTSDMVEMFEEIIRKNQTSANLHPIFCSSPRFRMKQTHSPVFEDEGETRSIPNTSNHCKYSIEESSDFMANLGFSHFEKDESDEEEEEQEFAMTLPSSRRKKVTKSNSRIWVFTGKR